METVQLLNELAHDSIFHELSDHFIKHTLACERRHVQPSTLQSLVFFDHFPVVYKK